MAAQTILIGKTWRGAASGQTYPVIDPATGETYGEIARGTAADVAAAVAAARAATLGVWSRVSPWDRGRILTAAAQIIEDKIDSLAQCEARDTGKPLKQARFDIATAARYFRFYGGLAGKLDGYTIPFDSNHQAFTLREPHGVTAHIVPWNYPSQMFARDVAPALMCGNAVVIKPAEEACQSPLRLAQILLDAGLPEGALNLVTGVGEEAGAALSAHPDIDHISFTGSTEVGTMIQAAAARNNIGCTMELGGKSPQIVFADADLAKAVPPIVMSIVASAGQTCSAGSRLLLERSIYDRFIDKLSTAFSAVRAGPWEMDLECGPLISATQKERVSGFLARARDERVTVLAEGSIASGASRSGYFVKPTLLGPVLPSNDLAQSEIFGPVLSVIPFDSERDALEMANGTPYGLVANVWTRDGGRQLRLAKGLRCGQVFVNGPGANGNVEIPFGGVKRSGYGREKGLAAFEEYTTLKAVLINHAEA